MVYLFIIFLNVIFSDTEHLSCIASIGNRDIDRQEYLFPEQIQSEHFVIHFTVYDQDFQNINGQNYSLESNFGYAQSLIDLAEFSLQKYINDGWELPPPDCDESIEDINSPNHCSNFGGNSLYDIYISNDGPGMVVPERPYSVEPYLGGYSTYMKISTLSNNYTTCPSWNYHVLAHEVHHAVQLRYGNGASGTPGNYIHNLWFFEQTASYMENVVFPNSIHLRTMLANCDVVTPLTFPEHGIDYPAELYQYRSALWHKFLVESLEDSSIVRLMWEDYGLQYNNAENQISLFPIYDNAIQTVTNNEYLLSDAFNDYSKWRYFTGERSIPNQYFNESFQYCNSTTYDINGPFQFLSNTGGAYFINLSMENENLILTTDMPDDIFLTYVTVNENNDIFFTDIYPEGNNFNFSSFEDQSNVLIVNTTYNNQSSDNIVFSILYNENNLLGDLNNDGELNVLDIVLMVTVVLNNEYIEVADVNQDNMVNILDVVLMVNILVGGLPNN